MQQYLSLKYDEFLNKQEDARIPCTLKIPAKEVGLQKFESRDVAEIGLEDTPKVWVLNFNLHILEDGDLLFPGESPYVWLGKVHNSPSPCIAPSGMASVAGDQDYAVLENLINSIEVAYINNFASAVLALGAQVLNVHYELVQTIEEGVPVATVYGDIACGNSKILDSCLSMMGTTDSDHSVKSCPDGQFINLSSRTILGIVYDDEDMPARLSGKIMKVFDQTSVAFQGKMVKPRTSFIAAVNTECFEGLVQSTGYK